MDEKNTCDHCGKKECEQCVKEDGKNFCCEHCCGDYKKSKEKQGGEKPNVCIYC